MKKEPSHAVTIDRDAVPCQECAVTYRDMSLDQVAEHFWHFIVRLREQVMAGQPARGDYVLAAACYGREMLHRLGMPDPAEAQHEHHHGA